MATGNKRPRAWSLLLLGLGLSACAVQHNQLGRDEQIDMQVGYVAATLVSRQIAKEAILLPQPPSIAAHFEPAARHTQEDFILRTYAMPQWDTPVIKNGEGGEYRIVLLIPVKPGRYWLSHVEAGFYGGYVRNMTMQAPYPAITIKPGEITYAGSIQVVANIGCNIEGQPRPGQVWLDIRNDFNHDIAMLRRQDARFSALPLTNGVQ